MVEWHQLNECEFEQIMGDSEGQGSLASYSLRGRKELDMTERLNNNNTQNPQHTILHGETLNTFHKVRRTHIS